MEGCLDLGCGTQIRVEALVLSSSFPVLEISLKLFLLALLLLSSILFFFGVEVDVEVIFADFVGIISSFSSITSFTFVFLGKVDFAVIFDDLIGIISSFSSITCLTFVGEVFDVTVILEDIFFGSGAGIVFDILVVVFFVRFGGGVGTETLEVFFDTLCSDIIFFCFARGSTVTSCFVLDLRITPKIL